MSTSEADLLDKAADGDRTALADLLPRVGARIAGELEISRRWRAIVDADDVMQITYLEAVLRFAGFRERRLDAFVGWLRHIARNNLTDAIREAQAAKRPQPQQRVDFPGEDSYARLVDQLGTLTTPSRVAAGRELQDAVDAALRRLPPDYERALRLFELEGRSVADAASAMGRSVGAVKMLLARGRERLAAELGSQSRFFSDSP